MPLTNGEAQQAARDIRDVIALLDNTASLLPLVPLSAAPGGARLIELGKARNDLTKIIDRLTRDVTD